MASATISIIPACFTADTWKQWKEMARTEKPGVNSYCADCTEEYQSLMIRQRRCAYPSVTFKRDADGFVEGDRKLEDKRAAWSR